MTRTLIFTIACITWITSTVSSQIDSAHVEHLQKWVKKDKMSTRAKEGEKVLIVTVNVKHPLKEDFEKWINDVLYQALENSESLMKKAQLKATRWLEPVKINKDSTWTYTWIMDPIIPNTNYDIQKFLILEYGEDLGKQHWENYKLFMAAPPKSSILRQTRK